MLRVFVALTIPEPTARQLLATQSRLNEATQRIGVNLRLTPSHQFHVTLAFLGNVTSEQIQSIVDVTVRSAARNSACQLSARGLTALPPKGRARVIAVSFEETTGALLDLVTSLQAGLRVCGHALENRAFHAHITVARLRAPQKIPQNSLGLTSAIEPFRCRDITVFQSVLRPDGAKYESLYSAPLRDI